MLWGRFLFFFFFSFLHFYSLLFFFHSLFYLHSPHSLNFTVISSSTFTCVSCIAGFFFLVFLGGFSFNVCVWGGGEGGEGERGKGMREEVITVNYHLCKKKLEAIPSRRLYSTTNHLHVLLPNLKTSLSFLVPSHSLHRLSRPRLDIFPLLYRPIYTPLYITFYHASSPRYLHAHGPSFSSRSVPRRTLRFFAAHYLNSLPLILRITFYHACFV